LHIAALQAIWLPVTPHGLRYLSAVSRTLSTAHHAAVAGAIAAVTAARETLALTLPAFNLATAWPTAPYRPGPWISPPDLFQDRGLILEFSGPGRPQQLFFGGVDFLDKLTLARPGIGDFGLRCGSFRSRFLHFFGRCSGFGHGFGAVFFGAGGRFEGGTGVGGSACFGAGASGFAATLGGGPVILCCGCGATPQIWPRRGCRRFYLDRRFFLEGGSFLASWLLGSDTSFVWWPDFSCFCVMGGAGRPGAGVSWGASVLSPGAGPAKAYSPNRRYRSGPAA